ncbi:MAG: DUF6785 family protein, partial [Planctomycetota bacterium]
RKYTWLSHGWGGMTIGRPMIWPTAVALAFFLAKDVTFSVGISQLLATILFAIMLHTGVMRHGGGMIVGKPFDWQKAGSSLALGLMLLYFGRRFYWQVLKSALTFRRSRSPAEGYTFWACWGMLISLGLLTALLVRVAGLDLHMAIGFVMLTMLAYLAVARITAEFGMFYVQIAWIPVTVLLGIFGAAAVGPAGLVTVGMLSTVLMTQPEESLMTFALMGLKISEGQRLSRGRAGSMAGLAFVVALVVALPFAVWVDYSHGGTLSGWWDSSGLPANPFNTLQWFKLTGEFGEPPPAGFWDRLASISPDGPFLWAAGIGFAAVLVTYVLRLRLTWWPIHPIMFLVWETWASAVFFQSFLLAWLIQVFVSRFGTQASRRGVKNLMVGIIAGELIGGLLWMCVGGVHFAAVGKPPPAYRIFPY